MLKTGPSVVTQSEYLTSITQRYSNLSSPYRFNKPPIHLSDIIASFVVNFVTFSIYKQKEDTQSPPSEHILT